MWAYLHCYNTFISCRLDNCNALLYRIADNQIQRLQSVQNAAAWLVTGSRRSEHITPVLRSLHWLLTRPSASHVQAGNAYPQVLERPGPNDLADFCLQTGDRRSGMRSAETWILHVPRARSTYGVAVAWSSIGNSLSPAIRDLSVPSQGFS